ncbi:MAG: hypothetical protein J2P17_02235 [Mycobacterium sp.]|nr:hypothetical protein [Mycobacterium sp.]
MVIQLVEVDMGAFAGHEGGMSVALTDRSIFLDAQCAELRKVLSRTVIDDSPQKASDPVRQ